MKYHRIILPFLTAITLTAVPVSAQPQRGKASFYSKRATGARTSSGERIHHDSLTCAHRTYPFGTLLKVTNERNGKWVVVRVTDRGPHSRGRIIDLSHGAAQRIGIIDQGVATVKVERYHDSNIPFRPDDRELPEIDFEVTEYTLPSSGVLHFPTRGKQHRQYVKIVDDDDTVAVKPAAGPAARKIAAKKSTTVKKTAAKKSSSAKRRKTRRRR